MNTNSASTRLTWCLSKVGARGGSDADAQAEVEQIAQRVATMLTLYNTMVMHKPGHPPMTRTVAASSLEATLLLAVSVVSGAESPIPGWFRGILTATCRLSASSIGVRGTPN